MRRAIILSLLLCGFYNPGVESAMPELFYDNLNLMCVSTTTDVPSYNVSFYGGHARSQNTVNTTGGGVKLCSGSGRIFYTVASYADCATDTFKIWVEGSVIATLIEGTHFDAITSNNVTASNLGAAIFTALGASGWSVTVASAVVYIDPPPGQCGVSVSSSDAVCATVTQGTSGTLTYWTGINASSDFLPDFYIRGDMDTSVNTYYGGIGIVKNGAGGGHSCLMLGNGMYQSALTNCAGTATTSILFSGVAVGTNLGSSPQINLTNNGITLETAGTQYYRWASSTRLDAPNNDQLRQCNNAQSECLYWDITADGIATLYKANGTTLGQLRVGTITGTTLPATCTQGEQFHDTDSNDCADTGAGDGALCYCKTANTWVLIKDL